MFSSIRRGRHHQLDIWPGFVDAMATLLMVIIFVLMTFVVAQFYLTEALSGRDEALSHINKQLESLHFTLKHEEKLKHEAEAKVVSFETIIADLKAKLGTLKTELKDEQTAKKDALVNIAAFSKQIDELKTQLAQLTEALGVEKTANEEHKKSTLSLSEQLKEAMAALEHIKGDNAQLKSENEKSKEKGKLGFFRSEFFAKLKHAIGDRSDIRIVGDRFVFQSEVLFSTASSDMGGEGVKQLDQLVKALKEIIEKIPSDMHWVLRVDGHTDILPIKTNQFPSNWELSAARAISVVKYLASQGIDSRHLVAAGFGEYQPLVVGGDIKDLARNRRIEFKLDQR